MASKFYEIFSKRESGKKQETPKPKIIVDYREKNSLVLSELIKMGFETEVRELKVADYIIRDVAIERKTISDFISSMLNKRLSTQIQELQQYPNKLLIIEGVEEQELYSDDERFRGSGIIQNEPRARSRGNQGVHANAIRGFLLSILLRHKIPIMFTKNPEDTAKFISVIAKKQEKETSLNVKKKSLNKREQLQFILEGFPGIGPKTAKKLLSEFKTLKNIINAPENELKKILRKKEEIFRNIIEGEY